MAHRSLENVFPFRCWRVHLSYRVFASSICACKRFTLYALGDLVNTCTFIIQARRKHKTGQGNNWRRSRPPTSPLVKDKGAATCNLMCICVTQQGQPPSFVMDLCITHYSSNSNPALDDTLHLPNARDNVLTYRSQMLQPRRFVNITLHTITTTLYLVHVRCR